MSIKKAYAPLIEFLNENADKKVKSVMDEIIALCSTKSVRSSAAVSNFIKDESGETVAIFDYYFKRWMPLVGDLAVEFGVKRNTPTGFNTMSKAGASHWTRQQRVAQLAHGELLNRVAAGEITPDQIPDEQAKIEVERKSIVETDLGFATREEVIEYLNSSHAVAVTPITEAA